MGAYLTQPNLEKVSENGDNDRIRYGASAMQGWRLAQEDDHNCLSLFAENTELFGVYDGHGGSEVAVYCAKHLPKLIKSSPAFKNGDLERALEESFMNFDASLKEEKVIQQLKEIAGLNNCSDAEDGEVDNLQEEANLPLGELLTKFGMPSNKNQRTLRKKVHRDDLLSPVVNKKKPVFPLLSDNNVSKTVTNGGAKVTESGETVAESEPVKTDIKDDEEDNSGKLVENRRKNGQNGNSSSTSASSTAAAAACDSHSKDAGQTASGKEESSSLSSQKAETEAVCNGKTEDEKTQEENHTKKETNDDVDEEEEEDEDFDEDEEDEEEEEFDDEDDDDDEGVMRPSSGHEEPGSDSGTTACVAVVKGNEIIVANIGDSRCVLSRDGEAVDLSVDHKPEDDEELQRIEGAGGKVTQDGRVNGGLNLSRAFGDHCYKTNDELPPEKQMICAFPDLQRTTLTDKDEFMVIACDGIWNAMTSQEVIDFVKEKLDDDSNVNLSDICEELFDICMAPDTKEMDGLR